MFVSSEPQVLEAEGENAAIHLEIHWLKPSAHRHCELGSYQLAAVSDRIENAFLGRLHQA